MTSLRYDPIAGGWTFTTPHGERMLRDPHGLPTSKQLRLLAGRGLLEIRDVPGDPLSKLDCARAIERAGYKRQTDDELAADMLEAVREHPGSTWGEIRALVRGAGVRLAWIRKQLVLNGRLVIIREGQRMRLYLPGAAP